MKVESEYLVVGEDFALDYGIKDFSNSGEGRFTMSANPDASFNFEGSGESIGEGLFFGRKVKVVRKILGKNSRAVVDRDSDGAPVYFLESHLTLREFEIFIEGEKKGHIALEESRDGISANVLRLAFNGIEIDEEWRTKDWNYSDLITAIYALETPLEFPEFPVPE